jgi:hypothetical protein
MTFDELWRRSLPRKDPVISSIDSQAEASFFRDPAFGESAFEDLGRDRDESISRMAGRDAADRRSR